MCHEGFVAFVMLVFFFFKSWASCWFYLADFVGFVLRV